MSVTLQVLSVVITEVDGWMVEWIDDCYCQCGSSGCNC